MFDRSRRVYANLRSFSLEIDSRVVLNGQPEQQKVRIAFQRPNRLRLEMQRAGVTETIVSDGRILTVMDKPGLYRQYNLAPTRADYVPDLIGLPMGLSGSLLLLVRNENEVSKPHFNQSSSHSERRAQKLRSIKVGQEILEGARIRRSISFPNHKTPTKSFQYTIRFDSKTGFLRRGQTLMTQGKTRYSRDEVITNFRANPKLAPAVFRFVPPPGARYDSRDIPPP